MSRRRYIFCSAPTDLEQEKKSSFFFPNLPKGSYCYGPRCRVFILKGQVNVIEIKSASFGQMGLNLRLPCEARVLSFSRYLKKSQTKQKKKDNTPLEKMSRKAPRASVLPN